MPYDPWRASDDPSALQRTFEDEMWRIVWLCVQRRCESCGHPGDRQEERGYCEHTGEALKMKAGYCLHWTPATGPWLVQLYLAVDGPEVRY